MILLLTSMIFLNIIALNNDGINRNPKLITDDLNSDSEIWEKSQLTSANGQFRQVKGFRRKSGIVPTYYKWRQA